MVRRSQRIMASFSDETYDKIVAKSKEYGITMSSLVSIMASEWLESKSMALSLEQIFELTKKEKQTSKAK